tara:strand:+ start:626 stop:964 length:339 start_codon:yes stop_codon:yes gene_type:complete
MADARLTAEFWIKAHIRRCAVENVPAVVVRRGDATAGQVILKLNGFAAGCRVLVPGSSLNGGRVWRQATGPEPVSEAEADAYIARQTEYDPDVWVLEIEDGRGRHFLSEPVE